MRTPDFKGFIICEVNSDFVCMRLNDLQIGSTVSGRCDGVFNASGGYCFISDTDELDSLIRSLAYKSLIHRQKNLVNDISNKRKELANLKKAVAEEQKRLARLKRS